MSATDNLDARVVKYAEKYGLGENAKTKGLEAYAVHLFAQEDGLDSVLEGEDTWDAWLADYILPNDDLGVDGVLTDDSAKRLVLIQCTWRTTMDKMEAKLNDFTGVVDRLLNPEFVKHGGDAAQQLLGSLKDQIDDGYAVELRFVTNMAVGDKDRLKAIVEATNNSFDDAGRKINLEMFGRAELDQLDEDLKNVSASNSLPEVTFAIQDGKFLTWSVDADAPRETLVGIIKGNELSSLYKTYGIRLFTANIRLPLATRKVNPTIRATAEEHPDDFFYYNNGVSAVCKEFELNGTQVKARGFQIINGAQTVDALRKSIGKKPNERVYVMFRLTESESYGQDKNFTQNVIQYNNTQNPVKVSDFFSNDPIQLWLSKNLDLLSGNAPMPVFYYVHKSGHRPSSGKGKKQLKIDVFAGIRHAFIYGPVTSYKEPATFFDRDGKYNEAFGVNGKPATSWDKETLAEAAAAIAINAQVQAIAKAIQAKQRELKKQGSKKELIEAKYLYRLSRYVGALVGVGLRAVIPSELTDFASLMASKKNFEKFTEPLIEHARNLVENEMLDLAETGAVQPEYNFARDEKLWRKLEKRMESAALTKISF